jgi:hypothetical protein
MRAISRRTALKGLGTLVGLPFLEAMGHTATPQAASPVLRMGFLYVPNGVHMQDWWPKSTGELETLSPTLSPLESLKDDINVMSGLTCDKARANGDGPGDHARAMSAFLTGSQPKKTAGADIRVGASADQVAAQKVGHLTRFPSLELGCEPGRQAGNCDSGYSCAYSSNLSWRSETTPQAKEVDPKAVFERLFGNGKKEEVSESKDRRDSYNKSILDFVREDASALRKELGINDQRKLDEYLSAIREIEQRLGRTDRVVETPAGSVTKPSGIPRDYEQHIRLMCDMIVLAFQADLTRIFTFPFANDGSNRSYKLIGVAEGHHDLSHHGNDKAKHEKIAKINKFHITQAAYLFDKLKKVKEGEGTLLDNCMIVYGSAIGDGNRHNHDDLPILLAGKGGGTIKSGRHVRYKRETPLTNLYVSMIQRMGGDVNKVGDSKGTLDSL